MLLHHEDCNSSKSKNIRGNSCKAICQKIDFGILGNDEALGPKKIISYLGKT
jgi:hypothetical protein